MKNSVIFWHLGKAITLALLVAAGGTSVHADEPQSTIPEYRYDKNDPKGGKAHYVKFKLNDDGKNSLRADVFDEDPGEYDYVWYEDIIGSEYQTSQEYTGGGYNHGDTYKDITGGAALSVSNVNDEKAEIKGAFYNNTGGAISVSDSVISSIQGIFTTNDSSSASTSAVSITRSRVGSISGDFLNNGQTNAGGAAICVSDESIVGSITGNFVGNRATSGTTSSGGAIWNKEGSTIEYISGIFDRNYGSKKGGAIANFATIGTIRNATFTGNRTEDATNGGTYGGAIANLDGGKISKIENSTFSGNYSVYGSAISNGVKWDGDEATASRIEGIVGTTFSDNLSSAIWNDGGYIGSISDSRFTGTKGIAINNKQATNTNATASFSAEINSISAIFSDNSDGDIKNLNSVIHSISRSTFTASSDETYQGKTGIAIWNQTATIGSISESSFTGYVGLYSASSEGEDEIYGAIVNLNASIDMIEKATFKSNYAKEYGGAIYNNSYMPDESKDSTISSISGTFEKNGIWGEERTVHGGAIANITNDYIKASAVIGTISATFTENEALQQGGAIHNGHKSIIGSVFESSFKENKSREYGGAIHNEGRINTIKDTTFEGNESRYIDENGNLHGRGGAIYNGNWDGIIGIETESWRYDEKSGIVGNGVFKNNKATIAGGAIYNENVIPMIEADLFEGNETERQDGSGGGAIYNKRIIYTIKAKTFKNNISGNDGGAIANVDGGGIWTLIEAETFEGNVALHGSKGGGAIFNNTGSTIGDIKIKELKDNVVGAEGSEELTSGGGGIANYGTIGGISIETASGNKSWRNNGGVILNWTTNSENDVAKIREISGTSFCNNFAFGSGGAIHNEGQGATIEYITVKEFRSNIALSSGGAVRNYKGAKITSNILRSNFYDNYARNRAGALYYEGNLYSPDKEKGTGIQSRWDDWEENAGTKVAYKGNESYNDGGAIVIAEKDSKIGAIKADFIQNKSGIWKERDATPDTWEWKEDRDIVPTVANGGAILNGFRYIDVNLDLDPETNTSGNTRSELQKWFDAHEPTGYDDGIPYYVLKDGASEIKWIESDFIGNTAGYSEDGTPHASDEALGSGGAICNGYIDNIINLEEEPTFDFWVIAPGKIGTIVKSHFADNAANYRGGAIYNARGEITAIENSTFSGNTAYRRDGYGFGGAIFNNKNCTIDSISTVLFSRNRAGGVGGAIYNETEGAEIGDIKDSIFLNNQATGVTGWSSDDPGTGGAIFNAGNIGDIIYTGTKTADINNFTVADDSFWTIKNDVAWQLSQDMNEAEANFQGNTAGGDGGAIYNKGKIGLISYTGGGAKEGVAGGFMNNTAGASGGAIHNEGSINAIERMDFIGNAATDKGTAFTNKGATGEIWNDSSNAREFDNTVVSGILNSNFKGNKTKHMADPLLTATASTSELYDKGVAALYTETDLALIVNDVHHVEFCDNVIGMDDTFTMEERESDIYVGAKNDKAADFYMIVDNNSSLTTMGVINGVEAGYALRLRGFAAKVENDVMATHGGNRNSGGTIRFEGLVKHADVIMDDVTLSIGIDQQNHRAVDTSKDDVAVYDDWLAHNQYGDLLDPDDVKFNGSGGDIGSIGPDNNYRTRSDVLRNSNLEVRSGRVMTADGMTANYNIGTIVSNGRMSYDHDAGYYSDAQLYATWSIDIDFDTLKADTFTTWYKEGEDKKAQSRGYMTLSGCTIMAKKSPQNLTEDWKPSRPLGPDGKPQTDNFNPDDLVEHDHSKDAVYGDDPFFGKYPEIEQYYDVNVQVINLIWVDKNGKANETYIPDEWKDERSPLQLDLGNLKTQKFETPYMDSDDLLCEGIGYGTTKTYHDSVHIWGWRDNLAAWSELQKKGGEEGRYDKEFHIIGEHLLTRNIKRYESKSMGGAGLLLQEKSLKIFGDDYTSNILNVGGYNLLSEVAEGQTVELKNLTVTHVGTGDVKDPERMIKGNIWQKTENKGTYILDMLKVDEEYTVMNDREAIKRGSWGIYNIFSSNMRSDVDLTDWTLSEKGQSAPDAIDNVLRLQCGRTYITGTIEYNNVSNEKDAETYLLVHDDADYRRANSTTRFADPDTAKGAFKRFYCNSLSMQDGNFYLTNLNSQELKLRDLHIGDGSIHINTATVDLEKEDMGRIWAYGHATYDGAGHIIVYGMDALVVKPKDGASDEAHYIERDGKKGYEIPVRFVNRGVAASVIPFGTPDDYADASKKRSQNYLHAKEGELYWYEVDYSYETGYYYYRRWLDPNTGTSELIPGVQVGPVAEAAGAQASMQQITDLSFEHADLFSAGYADSAYKMRDFTVVSVDQSKGYSGKGGGAVSSSSSCSDTVGFRGGMWVRPYATYEQLPLSGGPKVSNSLYGALVGGDTRLHEYRNGWASVFSVYAAYMGSTQKYSMYDSHVRINQNGGALGVVETLYHNNFYTALSATIGTASGHASTNAGTENFHMLLAGLASRSGYNFSYGRYVFQPTLLLSYSMVNMGDYKNASGTSITSAPMHTLQVHPYVKVVMSTNSCWSPFVTLGYVFNLTGQTHFRANGVNLPQMSTDPYVEYSLGIQKTFKDTYTIFGQATGRHGGRNGAELSAGIRRSW